MSAEAERNYCDRLLALRFLLAPASMLALLRSAEIFAIKRLTRESCPSIRRAKKRLSAGFLELALAAIGWRIIFEAIRGCFPLYWLVCFFVLM